MTCHAVPTCIDNVALVLCECGHRERVAPGTMAQARTLADEHDRLAALLATVQ